MNYIWSYAIAATNAVGNLTCIMLAGSPVAICVAVTLANIVGGIGLIIITRMIAKYETNK